jgi:ribonuclease VapC
LIVDTSALVAIMRNEPERADFLAALAANNASMSAVTYFEFGIVTDSARDAAASAEVDVWLSDFDIGLVPVTPEHARLAREAYARFGKGNHPARLNFGDCFAYALAKAANEPLLFKGNDFSRTDIPAAV